MLRDVDNGRWGRTGAWFWKRYVFTAGRLRQPRGITGPQLDRMAAEQTAGAVLVMTDGNRRYWWSCDRFFWEDAGLSARDVYALVHERHVRAQRKLQRAHAVLAQGAPSDGRREPIPREVRRLVFDRDGGACVACGSTFDIQYDHVIPFSMGGASTPENLQILCASCNQAKGAAI